MSDYAKLRAENIRRNQLFLQSLGLENDLMKKTPAPPRAKKPVVRMQPRERIPRRAKAVARKRGFVHACRVVCAAVRARVCVRGRARRATGARRVRCASLAGRGALRRGARARCSRSATAVAGLGARVCRCLRARSLGAFQNCERFFVCV